MPDIDLGMQLVRERMSDTPHEEILDRCNIHRYRDQRQQPYERQQNDQ